MATSKTNPSEHYKHFRKAVAFPFRKLELAMSTLPFQGGVIFRTFVPDSGFDTYAMFTAMVIYPKTVEITCPK
jgi:hypothetical protein